MFWKYAAIFAALGLILGAPFLIRPSGASPADSRAQKTLVIVTPHVQQIRDEFSRAFSAWHQRVHGEPVQIDWRLPGGTSEIIKQLEAQYTSALKRGEIKPDGSCPPGTIGFDMMFGGGSFDHGRLKTGVVVKLDQKDAAGKPIEVKLPMSIPAGIEKSRLDECFGDNVIGAGTLYDPDQYWIGTALSSFGIVYNRDVLKSLGLSEPSSFEDLCRPEYAGWLALADPRQSGSITTTFDSILSSYGWDKGWRILREMCANARYFTNSSTKPPIDVSQGEAAAGLAIDFYGRGQAQSIIKLGEDPATARVGYVDPKGTVYVDADPVSILRGGPNIELSKRFVEFCLTEEAQALWQFPSARDPRSAGNPSSADGIKLGPAEYELRRMPARRSMYANYSDHFIDRVNPFELASGAKPAGWRSSIGLMMGAFAIDTSTEQRAAWQALLAARNNPSFPRDVLDRMENTFYSWPPTVIDGKPLEFTKENYKAIREFWRKPDQQQRSKIEYTKYFLNAYSLVVKDSALEQPIHVASSPQ
jgi:ABC-type Fe3+ transport system substrate-binding protein